MNFTHILLLACISLVSCSQNEFPILYNTLSTTGAFPANVFDLANGASKEDVEAIHPNSGVSLLHVVTDPIIYKILLEKNPSLDVQAKGKTPLQSMELHSKSDNVEEIIKMLKAKQSDYSSAAGFGSLGGSKKGKLNEPSSDSSDEEDKKENSKYFYTIPAIILILIIMIVILEFIFKKGGVGDDAVTTFTVKEEKDLI